MRARVNWSALSFERNYAEERAKAQTIPETQLQSRVLPGLWMLASLNRSPPDSPEISIPDNGHAGEGGDSDFSRNDPGL